MVNTFADINDCIWYIYKSNGRYYVKTENSGTIEVNENLVFVLATNYTYISIQYAKMGKLNEARMFRDIAEDILLIIDEHCDAGTNIF